MDYILFFTVSVKRDKDIKWWVTYCGAVKGRRPITAQTGEVCGHAFGVGGRTVHGQGQTAGCSARRQAPVAQQLVLARAYRLAGDGVGEYGAAGVAAAAPGGTGGPRGHGRPGDCRRGGGGRRGGGARGTRWRRHCCLEPRREKQI